MNAISGLIRRTDFGAGWAARYVRRPAVYKEAKREFSMSMGALHSTQRKADLHIVAVNMMAMTVRDLEYSLEQL